MRDFTINYKSIPVLAIGFTRAETLIAKGIQLFRGILKDKAAPNHAFIVTQDHGQLFATEETPRGLCEMSLEQYVSKKNRIVAMYEFKAFSDSVLSEQVQECLAEIRRRASDDSKYDWGGLFSFVPVLKYFPWCKPDPKKQWCSENAASVLKRFGADFISKTEIAPDTLLSLMQKSEQCVAVLNYYA